VRAFGDPNVYVPAPEPPRMTDRADARDRDREDPLAAFADRFRVPDELYMDGNSLGALSADAEATLERAVDQWRDLGIRGWTEADPPWWQYGERLGDRLAPLVGAREDEVVAANATTVNIHSLIGTFLDAADAPGVVVNELDFPTDHYAIRAQLRARGHDPDDHLHVVESRDGRTIEVEDVIATLDREDVAVLFFPSVLYRSGQLFDLERLAAAAHERGAYAGFDLAHSVGVVPHDLAGTDTDFAVWCGYKYLNAGPGAIAGLYVDEEQFGRRPALPGWWGNDKDTQFELRPRFDPADSAGAWQIGTVPVFSAAPLFGALDVTHEAGIDRIREKSVALTEYLVELADRDLAEHGYSVGTPRDPDRRGGHVALEHPEAYGVSGALRDRGVVTDFRPPNVIRVCPAPLYAGFEDVYDVVEACRDVVVAGEHDASEAEGGVT
jgi:kynureninase